MTKNVTAIETGRSRRVALAAVLVTLLGASSSARELKPQTAAAFDRYVERTEQRMVPEIAGTQPFLWIDRQPEPQRAALMARLSRGEILVERLETRDGGKPIVVNDALVHHWVGTILLKNVLLDKVLAFVQDYGRYAKAFAPMIQRATITSQRPDHFDVAIRTYAHKVITVVLDADYHIDYRRISPTREYTKSHATDILEVANAGLPTEKRTPSAQGTGYLWRLVNYCFFEQRPEGTIEQCESVSLTRDAPFGLGWMIRPFITGIPRETLELTLGGVRASVPPER